MAATVIPKGVNAPDSLPIRREAHLSRLIHMRWPLYGLSISLCLMGWHIMAAWLKSPRFII